MKKPTVLFAIGTLLFVTGLLGVGCKKQAASDKPQGIEGAFQDLRAALVKASPQVQSNLYNGVDSSLRYDKFFEALMYLDAIANDPSLNDQQKKAVNQVIEMVKEKIQNKTPAPAK